ncbi:hypothetical protein ACFW9X_38590, partial [Streptomyces sp. NPDC059466]|uniref:hypothetical protein n=1 Tax=Streptomyces sp. NPDC059466 TaxID=3346843 RepID=UPI0036C54506
RVRSLCAVGGCGGGVCAARRGGAPAARWGGWGGGPRPPHDQFGLGTVVGVKGTGANAEATVDFGEPKPKRLLLRYAPVEKL